MRSVGKMNPRRVWRISLDNYFQYKNKFPHLKFDTDTGWGWLPPNDQVFNAFEYVKNFIEPKNILEIGYYRGHSTSYLAHVFQKARIISCCPDHPKYRDSHVRKIVYGNGRIEVLPIKSPGVISHLPENVDFDFAFIDGNHALYDVYSDIHVALRLETPYIMFDNAEQEEVKLAIQWYINHGCLEKIKSFTYTGLSKGKYKNNDLTLYKNISGKIRG